MPGRVIDTTDEDLARSAQAGSSAAFAELVRRYDGRLYGFLLRRCGSAAEAEDLAQETFLRAWRHVRSYSDRWRFSTWIFTIARRLAATRRRRPVAATDVVEGQVAAFVEPSGVLDDRDTGSRLWTLVDRLLDDDERTALWLRYAEDLPARDIARVLGRTPVSVRVMLHRARQRLLDAERRREATTPATTPPAMLQLAAGGANQ